jgi:hypothetical protein
MYSQLDLAAAQKQSGTQAADLVDITQVGAESVAGQSATKYKMVMKDGSGGGFIWITSDGIPIKMDMLSKSRGEKTRMTLTLTNLKIGAQDPQLFEVPDGYTAMPKLGGAGGFGGFMGGRAGAANPAGVPGSASTPNAAGGPNAANPADASGSSGNAAQPEQPSAAAAAAKSGLSTLGNTARGLFHRH